MAEKLASIGQLAAGVAHEINNPIGFIKSNLATASGYVGRISGFGEQIRGGADSATLAGAWRQLQMDFVIEDFPALLKESIDGAERVARIVSDLKDFSGVDQTDQQLVDVNEMVRSVCAVVAHGRDGQTDLAFELEADSTVLGAPGHLRQALMNVVLNAFQAAAGRGAGK